MTVSRMMKDIKLPDTYMDEDTSYDLCEQSEHHSYAGSSVQVFLARRKGRGHIAKAQPCQDYALSAEMKYGVILTAADGLGSCECSDYGSRFACESAIQVIKEIAEESASEENLIRQMRKHFERRRIHSAWLHRIKKDLMVRCEYEKDQFYEKAKAYNSTLMFAVITEHYMVGSSIGDGQILFFNNETAYRLRPQLKKESSMTDSLLDPRSWLEGFETAVFKRGLFSGVLLSTDGIYDFLSEGISFHLYANQLSERFLACGKAEFPFDYVTEDGKVHHLYENGTFDDCTIHLAYVLNPLTVDPVQEYVNAYSDQNAIDRMSGSIRKYSIVKDGCQYAMISSGKTQAFDTDQAVILECLEQYESGGTHYSLYPKCRFTSIEQMHVQSELNMNRLRDTAHLMRIVKIYESLKRLADDLASKDLILNESAGFLCGFDTDGHLCIYREAVSKMKPNTFMDRYSAFEEYFRSLYGALVFENRKMSLFRYGMNEDSNTVMRFDGLGKGMLGIVSRKENQVMLINRSGIDWTDQDRILIHTGEILVLKKGVSFSFRARNDILLTIHFTAKEDL